MVEGGRVITFVLIPSFSLEREGDSPLVSLCADIGRVMTILFVPYFSLVEGWKAMTFVFLPWILFSRGRESDDLCVSYLDFL
jgi:hypothetical protein